MSIKFANEIINEIVKRGYISVPKGSVSGEEFEKWLYGEECSDIQPIIPDDIHE